MKRHREIACSGEEERVLLQLMRRLGRDDRAAVLSLVQSLAEGAISIGLLH